MLRFESRIRGQHVDGADAEVAANGRGRCARTARLQVQELSENPLLCHQSTSARFQRGPHSLLAAACASTSLRKLQFSPLPATQQLTHN